MLFKTSEPVLRTSTSGDISYMDAYTWYNGGARLITGTGVSSSITLTNDSKQNGDGSVFVMICDLTQMFGSDENICSALNVPNLTSTYLPMVESNFRNLFHAEYYAHRTQPPKSNPNPFGIFPQYLIFIIKAISDAQDGPKMGLPKVGEKRKSTK